MLKPGWLKKQFESAKKEYEQLPTWLRKSGLEEKEMESKPRSMMSQTDLRDWFAGMALQAIIQKTNVSPTFCTKNVGDMANTAYEMADAMLKAKEGEEQKHEGYYEHGENADGSWD